MHRDKNLKNNKYLLVQEVDLKKIKLNEIKI